MQVMMNNVKLIAGVPKYIFGGTRTYFVTIHPPQLIPRVVFCCCFMFDGKFANSVILIRLLHFYITHGCRRLPIQVVNPYRNSRIHL